MNWKEFLEKESQEDYFKSIFLYLKDRQANGAQIFPEKKNIFRLFKESNGVYPRVVILGQDPYPTKGDANGIAFSVNRSENLPRSLKNIFEEIKREYGFLNVSGDLSSWVRQGVFLLNTRLTVEEGKPMSHANIGYDILTGRVLKAIVNENPDVIFMLFGKEAEKYKEYAKEENRLITSHPSPLAAHRGFLGSNIFKRANARLLEQGNDEIDWHTS